MPKGELRRGRGISGSSGKLVLMDQAIQHIAPAYAGTIAWSHLTLCPNDDKGNALRSAPIVAATQEVRAFAPSINPLDAQTGLHDVDIESR